MPQHELSMTFTSKPQRERFAVVEHPVHGKDVVHRLSKAQRPGTGRVVSAHPTDGATRRRRRLDRKEQAVLAQKVVQRVQDGAGPDAHCPRRGIIIRHAVEMPGHVQDQAIPDRLAVLGRAPAPGDDRHVMRRGNRQRCLKIGLVLREDHPLGVI